MRIEVVTLFPDFFDGPLRTGLTGRALDLGLASVGFVDPRDFTRDRHRTVDDTPYGGGAGMVMKVEPLLAAIEAARGSPSARDRATDAPFAEASSAEASSSSSSAADAARSSSCRVVLMSPQGAPLQQADLKRWSQLDRLVLVAGRYEGFDERVSLHVDEECSLGDFVVTGGEYAALAVIDGVVRLLPGTLGNAASPCEDSFSHGLLEHPQYTRPPVYEGAHVPEVLMSGDHARIRAWRRQASLARTRARRPELLKEVSVSPGERANLFGSSTSGLIVDLAIELAFEEVSDGGPVEGGLDANRLDARTLDAPGFDGGDPRQVDVGREGRVNIDAVRCQTFSRALETVLRLAFVYGVRRLYLRPVTTAGASVSVAARTALRHQIAQAAPLALEVLGEPLSKSARRRLRLAGAPGGAAGLGGGSADANRALVYPESLVEVVDSWVGVEERLPSVRVAVTGDPALPEGVSTIGPSGLRTLAQAGSARADAEGGQGGQGGQGVCFCLVSRLSDIPGVTAGFVALRRSNPWRTLDLPSCLAIVLERFVGEG